jgi:hypothetical protein
MPKYRPKITDSFVAPLLPGRNSWIQQYFQLSRWLTVPAIVFVGIFMVWLLRDVSAIWLVIVFIGIPVNFIGFHLLAARAFANIDVKKSHDHKMIIDNEAIRVSYPDKDWEVFPIEEVRKIKLIYSGYERAFFPSGRYFNGAQNELIFQYRNRKVTLRFRLISRKHFLSLKKIVAEWYRAELNFEEFSRTSGLPVKTHLLDLP